ncbi:hypothetical protein Zmor_005793 [Zophobas morio]|uniref:Uncharacterized protein n=1 Tax=Zophobas morio TaxID=2755281 RepID=A0AA38IQD6_9CUCU|nr:hypothetical protein Zmor_005793 [Zophobas morio]
MEVPWAPASCGINDEMSKQRRRSEFPGRCRVEVCVTACPTDDTLQLFWEGSRLPTTVGIHRIRSPTQNWLRFSISGIIRSATKTKKLRIDCSFSDFSGMV